MIEDRRIPEKNTPKTAKKTGKRKEMCKKKKMANSKRKNNIK